MKNIVIFGSSGHGSVVLDCLEREGKYNVVGFLDSFKKKGRRHCGYPILGNAFDLPYLMDKHEVYGGIVAIGDNWIRSTIVDRIAEVVPNFTFISAIHPSAIIGRDVKIGKGIAIMPGVILNANSQVNDFCILNTCSSLDHDGLMEEYSSLAPKVCIGGGFSIGKFSAICLGTQIIENVRIGQHTVVGAGSLVVMDIDSYSLAYGAPAKVIRKRNKGEAYLSVKKTNGSTIVKSIASNF
jgi:sugar O-acyltransferase (sialic acid O-acetyltransferase NeuD family)